MLHALINAADAAVLRYEDFASPPPALPAAKGLRWLPVADIRPEPGAGETLTGPDVTVTNNAMTRTWRVEPESLAARLAQVQAARRDAYPAIGDQLDAAFKARTGDPAAQSAIDAAIAAVKAAHPKPAA